MAFLSVLLITLICVVVCHYFWTNYFGIFINNRKISLLSGPPKFMTQYLRGTPDGLLIILSIVGKYYPSPFKLSTNFNSFVVIYEPNQAKTILHSPHCLNKSIFYKFTEQQYGQVLLTVSESLWNRYRKVIAPSFDPNILQEYFHIFVEQSLILVNELEKVGVNGNEITSFKHIRICALDIACKTMIGIKLKSHVKDQFLESITRLKEILRYRLFSLMTCGSYMVFYNAVFNFTSLGREQRKILKSAIPHINKIMQELQQQRLNTMHTMESHESHRTVLDMLLEALKNENVTDKSIHDNIIMLVIMASETISITVDFAIFMLANFPEIQEKVYKELAEICGTETPMSAPVKYDDLQNMHYLDRVIKETMRLFPAIPILGRQSVKDMNIGNFSLPKNTNVMIALILMNRHEMYWPNPLKFDPDRFLPEKIKDVPSYYHIPFSDGPRDCISAKYAMISIKVILATLVQTFVFKVDKNIHINKINLGMDIMLSAIEPLKVKIEKRNL
ncbi:cytochrome P450 4c21 [Solenopsis invicta]|uniref:cytochrome P450 4c21 n=1 Tax=Solenopsis invicta TaxID=13686 RepID=UPI00193C9E0B|nr:cytochrome P450 4c21 [Solenopsis invicta]